ncbi:hypothetical protein [Saccharicrinis sp. FJH54]|uniref:hypothetical protein n=1 Tax=Saccharicrinis sp. FJH54 TaxID=3344665 RepID=UPI0035D4209D
MKSFDKIILFALVLSLYCCEKVGPIADTTPTKYYSGPVLLDIDRIISDLPDDLILTIPTYDNSNQVVHPDILIDTFSIYMVLTPYPNGNDKFENPCLYTSDDGINFIPYAKNPIVDKPPYDHNCDPDIFTDASGNLCIYYIETLKPEYNNLVLLFKKRNHDDFIKKVLIKYDFRARESFIVSPAFIRDLYQDTYHLFYVNLSAKPIFKIEYLTSDSLHQWNKNDPVTVNMAYPDNFRPWHIDITSDQGKYYLFINGIFGERNNNDLVVYLAESSDLENWNIMGQVLNSKKIPDNDMNYVYRSTGIIRNDVMVIWYSYVTKHNIWKMGLKKLRLQDIK